MTTFTYSNSRTVQSEVPTTGTTVIVDPNSNDVQLLMSPSGTLAALEIDFPDDNHSILGQKVDIWSSHTITSITQGGTPTVDNFPNTLLANSMASFVRIGSMHWSGTSQ